MAMIPVAAQADVAGRYEMVGENIPIRMSMTVEADETGNVRLQMGSQPGYYLVMDDDIYAVGGGMGRDVVARVADISALADEKYAEFFAEVPVHGDDEMALDLVPMGDETVNGRTGTAYGMAVGEGGEAHHASMVISRDPALAPLGRAMQTANGSMFRNAGTLGTMFSMLNADIAETLAEGALLRMLTMELTDVSFDPIPPARFALPSEPLSLDELRAMTAPEPAPPTLPPVAAD
ncbi:hypothetical protein [Aurantiacibacter spongiae]|uniref:hypothetical protein n=1 Tax=Aurantiacibacter spongiae TaxID=2488860 RepID=UPI001315325F|nr:hypothetical protein [Aurantiacibacter spongiae]